jgi:NADH:ubiquinone oxidoreductase subunit F (NADH-binding)
MVSLNYLFHRTELYEIEFGITIRQIVEELGGGMRAGELKGVIIGGPLAGIIPPDRLDTPFGFEELNAIGAAVGHGGVIAFDEHTSIPELLHHVCSFAANESCGKCTPCRLGGRRLERRFARPPDHEPGERLNRDAGERILATLKRASLCGLGTGLAEFVESAMHHYRKELEPCWE